MTPTASDAAKDSQCTTEFGSTYVAATALDLVAAFRSRFASAFAGDILFVLAAETDTFYWQEGGDNIEFGPVTEFTPPSQSPLVCIHR